MNPASVPGLWLAVAVMLGQLVACTQPAASSTATPEATVRALQTQVGGLSAQLATATLLPAPNTPQPAVPTSAQGPAAASPDVEAIGLEEGTIVGPEPTTAPVAQPPPTLFPTRTPRPLTAEDASPCEIGQIKGNIQSKIYHVPLGGSYARTKNRVACFATEADAEAAGYRKARN